MVSWCLFCKTGLEKYVAEFLTTLNNKIKAIVPTRTIQEKRKGKWTHKEQVLFPGYIFIYAEEGTEVDLTKKAPGLYKVLNYDIGLKKLRGMDYKYSMWIYRHQGNIDTSKVLTEGGTVKVIEGPLLDGIGTIIRLDKHKRRIWVEFEFDNQLRTVSLSAECVEKAGS